MSLFLFKIEWKTTGIRDPGIYNKKVHTLHFTRIIFWVNFSHYYPHFIFLVNADKNIWRQSTCIPEIQTFRWRYYVSCTSSKIQNGVRYICKYKHKPEDRHKAAILNKNIHQCEFEPEVLQTKSLLDYWGTIKNSNESKVDYSDPRLTQRLSYLMENEISLLIQLHQMKCMILFYIVYLTD